jgi:hypothetical protein
MPSTECAIALAKRAAAEESLTIAERDLQRVRERGSEQTSCEDRVVMRAPNYRALPYPVAGKATPDVNALDKRRVEHEESPFSEPFADGGLTGAPSDEPLTGERADEKREDGEEAANEHLYGHPRLAVPEVDAEPSLFDVLTEIRRSFLGFVYDAYYFESIPPSLVRSHGFRHKVEFILMRDGRFPHLCLAFFAIAFAFLLLQA